MRGWLAAVTFSCCSLVAGEALTENQGPDYIKLKALLPPAPGAQACYARTYDPDHLKRHPKQTVTEMVFSLRYVTLGEEEAVIVATEGGGTEKRHRDRANCRRQGLYPHAVQRKRVYPHDAGLRGRREFSGAQAGRR